MNQHIDHARKQLSDLASLVNQTERMERAILAAAEGRLAAVSAELGKISAADAVTEPSKDAAYRELIEERGILHQVISKARAELESA